MSYTRVKLSSIPGLTFYKDAYTLAKRGSPIPQLTCIGKGCKLFTPDVVRCTNLGGSGTEVDWKVCVSYTICHVLMLTAPVQCEADLPEALRFGRVEVSCEGWSGPGDPYVLKGMHEFTRRSRIIRANKNEGSCGLEYRLVEVPRGLRSPDAVRYPRSWFRGASLTAAHVLLPLVDNHRLRFRCSGHHIHGDLGGRRSLHRIQLPQVLSRRQPHDPHTYHWIFGIPPVWRWLWWLTLVPWQRGQRRPATSIHVPKQAIKPIIAGLE